MNGVLLSIYRRRNAALVKQAVNEILELGWSARLWALDEVDPDLRELTVDVGPGSRTQLLNRLHENVEEASLICDDDVVFEQPIRRFLAVVAACKFDLAQPAHAWSSDFTQPITACRPWAIARTTDFVEIGPVLYVGPRAADVVFPMDESASMGWGLELEWRDAMLAGRIRGGIVDAVPIRHLGAVGSDYLRSQEHALLNARLADRGLQNLRQVQHTLVTHWRLPT